MPEDKIGLVSTPEGWQWIGAFSMSVEPSDLLKGRKEFKISDVVGVALHPSGRWAVVDMGDTVSWVRIPDEVNCVEFRRQDDLRELPKTGTEENTDA